VGSALRRLGAFCARHHLAVIIAWLIVSAGAVTAVHVFGAKTNNNLELPGTGSQAAFDLLENKFPPQENGTNPFLFRAPSGKLTDERYASAMHATSAAIAASKHVYSSTEETSEASCRTPTPKKASCSATSRQWSCWPSSSAAWLRWACRS
jgi:uncharacterized membrane protein YdfJ with MMPL/SSD domain